MKLWKRNAVVAAVVLFVCMAVYLNWSYNQELADADVGKVLGEAALVGAQNSEDTVVSDVDQIISVGDGLTVSGNNYFASARLNRQQARDAALGLLREAARDDEAEQTVKDAANQSIQTMADITVSEAQIENLVTAKGYSDCVAFIGENSISVVVGAVEGGLTTADTAKITDIVTGETDFTANQIKIIEAHAE